MTSNTSAWRRALTGWAAPVSTVLAAARLTLAVASIVVVAASVLVAPAVASPGDTTRESVSASGEPGNQASSRPSLSTDGRLVAFASDASNLVAGDGNGRRDVFVRDRQAATIAKTSVAGDGSAGDGPSENPAISGNGRYVAFESAATNLVVGDTNGQRDVFVRDRQAGTTVRMSVPSVGASNGASSQPAISADGRYVAFISNASNLVAGDTNASGDVFVHDRDADGDGVFDEPGATTTARVSVASDGSQANGASSGASISADGEHVAFVSAASNLVAGDTNASGGGVDVFVRDRVPGTTTRVSVTTAGGQSDSGLSSGASISADGRDVAFDSSAMNLVAGDTNSSADVFVRDRDTDGDGVYDEPGDTTTTRVSVTSDGRQADAGGGGPSISADGRRVEFFSTATDLVGNVQDVNVKPSIFVHDRDADADASFDESGSGATSTTRESVASDDTPADTVTVDGSIAPDGSRVAFASAATNLVANDTNALADVFVHRLIASADLRRLSVSQAGDGQGTLTSSPAGIDCGSHCTQEYLLGTVVTVTPTAGSGSEFTGFSGACTGSGPCTVTLDQARSVTATFQRLRRALTVSRAGDGQGTLTSSPAGIDCGSRCAQEYLLGSVVTVTATAGSGSEFTGFSGACTGTGPCTVMLDQARSVTAIFKNAGGRNATPPGPGPSPRPGPGASDAVKAPAELQVVRVRVLRGARRLEVLAPIGKLASGHVRVQFRAAGRSYRFSERIDSVHERISFRRPIPAAQARVGTGILTISYPGDADTRAQEVRLRAASRPAALNLRAPRITDGRLHAHGTISPHARGVVRVGIEYVVDGKTATLALSAPIRNGRWALDRPLSQTARDGIARRQGTVQSYVLFTGYQPTHLSGELKSFQLLGNR